jgi:very-short-patch-repair endonuclease
MPTFHRPIAPLAKARARALRVEATDAEKALWRFLRDRRLTETKWRRQVPIGDFIVDFVCLEHRVIVECDGSQHAENRYDAVRDAWLRSQGFAIVRFWNHEAVNQRTEVVDTILARCGLPW